MVIRLSCMSISIATRNMSREIPGTATVGPLFPYYSHRNPLKYGIWEGGPTMGVPEEILKHGKLMEIILIIITHARHVCRQSACVVQCSSLRYFQSISKSESFSKVFCARLCNRSCGDSWPLFCAICLSSVGSQDTLAAHKMWVVLLALHASKVYQALDDHGSDLRGEDISAAIDAFNIHGL